MSTVDHRSIIEFETTRLIDLLDTADPETPVPTCEKWTLADLVKHTSTVHRMATAALTDAPIENGRPVFELYDGSQPLVDWATAGGTALLEALDNADLDHSSWTFIGDRPKRFWLRRMAAETAVHRWDGENAVGVATPFDPDHSVDMIDEFFDVHSSRKTADAFADDEGRTLHLHANDADGEWVITRHAAGIDVEHAHAKSTTAIRGTASSLVLFVWNRPLPDDIEIFGDESQIAEWAEQMRV